MSAVSAAMAVGSRSQGLPLTALAKVLLGNEECCWHIKQYPTTLSSSFRQKYLFFVAWCKRLQSNIRWAASNPTDLRGGAMRNLHGSTEQRAAAEARIHMTAISPSVSWLVFGLRLWRDLVVFWQRVPTAFAGGDKSALLVRLLLADQ